MHVDVHSTLSNFAPNSSFDTSHVTLKLFDNKILF